MLINPNNAAPTKGATVGGLRWSPRPGGSVIGAQPVNNLDSPSNDFQTMNESIIRLDNQYEALATSDKTDWINAAALIPKGKVCGCKTEKMSGKKLYRLQNYARGIFSQEQTTTPIIPASHHEFPALLIGFSDRRTPEYWYFYPRSWSGSPALHIILQELRGDNNPTVSLPVATESPWWISGTPAYDALAEIQQEKFFKACFFDSEGWPLGTGNFYIGKY